MPLSVCLSNLSQLGVQRLGQLGLQRRGQASRAVWTADPSAHGRRSTTIGGGHIVSPCDNLFLFIFINVLYACNYLFNTTNN